MRLPRLLQEPDDCLPTRTLQRYYNLAAYRTWDPFTGANFDTWDSSGTRQSDRDRFTADDLIAVSFLSVNVAPAAAIELLDSRATHFSALLTDLGADRDLADEHEPWPANWPGWTLWRELTDLTGVGPTTASKLLARKRPRLRPIYDSVVATVIGTQQLWEGMRLVLTTTPSLHDRLVSLRSEAGLPDQVSALRVFDVLTWMEGKGYTKKLMA